MYPSDGPSQPSPLRKLLENRFFRNVATVFTGTAAAQALPLAAAPLLTRLYSPDEFGVFALYLSVITMAGVISTGRYEMAINLPKTEQGAFSAFVLSCLIAAATTILYFAAVILLRDPLEHYLGTTDTFSLILLPFGALALAGFRTFSYWAIFRARFRGLSAAKVAQAGSITAGQLGAGAAAMPGGLLYGQVGGSIVGAGFLFLTSVRADLNLLKTTTLKDLKSTASKYRKFPLFSLPADFSNTLTGQLPVLMLGVFFGSYIVGLFALTQRVLGAPLALLGTSVQEVFKERASRDFRETGSCRDIYLKTLKALSALAIIPFVILFIVAPALFELVFGESWRGAGDYARIMVPMFFLRFIASPLSYVLYISEKQQYDLAWQIALLSLTATSLWIGGHFDQPAVGIALYVSAYSLMYLIYLMMSYHFSERHSP